MHWAAGGHDDVPPGMHDEGGHGAAPEGHGGHDVEGGHDHAYPAAPAVPDAAPAAPDENTPDMEAAIDAAFGKGYRKGKGNRNQVFAEGWYKGKNDNYYTAFNAGKGKGWEKGKGKTKDGFEFVNQ